MEYSTIIILRNNKFIKYIILINYYHQNRSSENSHEIMQFHIHSFHELIMTAGEKIQQKILKGPRLEEYVENFHQMDPPTNRGSSQD